VIAAVAVPGLYSTSCQHADELVRLGQRNEWVDLGFGLTRGFGTKVYNVGERARPLVELRDLAFDSSVAGSTSPGSEVEG
jgi:protein involved in temperature-dependent protein secretion